MAHTSALCSAALPPQDGAVRDAAKRLTVELARWVGAETVRATLMGDKVRDSTKADLAKMLEDVPQGRPSATRFTRKESARREVRRRLHYRLPCRPSIQGQTRVVL